MQKDCMQYIMVTILRLKNIQIKFKVKTGAVKDVFKRKEIFFELQGGPNITANLYFICLIEHETCA